jgi:hypothetical protein
MRRILKILSHEIYVFIIWLQKTKPILSVYALIFQKNLGIFIILSLNLKGLFQESGNAWKSKMLSEDMLLQIFKKSLTPPLIFNGPLKFLSILHQTSPSLVHLFGSIGMWL